MIHNPPGPIGSRLIENGVMRKPAAAISQRNMKTILAALRLWCTVWTLKRNSRVLHHPANTLSQVITCTHVMQFAKGRAIVEFSNYVQI